MEIRRGRGRGVDVDVRDRVREGAARDFFFEGPDLGNRAESHRIQNWLSAIFGPFTLFLSAGFNSSHQKMFALQGELCVQMA